MIGLRSDKNITFAFSAKTSWYSDYKQKQPKTLTQQDTRSDLQNYYISDFANAGCSSYGQTHLAVVYRYVKTITWPRVLKNNGDFHDWNVVNFCKIRYNRTIEDLKNSTCRQQKVFNQGIRNHYVDPASSAYRILRHLLVSLQPPGAGRLKAIWLGDIYPSRHLSIETDSIW